MLNRYSHYNINFGSIHSSHNIESPWVLINAYMTPLKYLYVAQTYFTYMYTFLVYVKIVVLLKIKHVLSNPFKN